MMTLSMNDQDFFTFCRDEHCVIVHRSWCFGIIAVVPFLNSHPHTGGFELIFMGGDKQGVTVLYHQNYVIACQIAHLISEEIDTTELLAFEGETRTKINDIARTVCLLSDL